MSVFCYTAFGQIVIRSEDMVRNWQVYSYYSGENSKNFFNPTKGETRASWDIIGTAHSNLKEESYVYEPRDVRFGDTIEGTNMVVVRGVNYHMYKITAISMTVLGRVELHTDTAGKDSVIKLFRNITTHDMIPIRLQFEDSFITKDTVHYDYAENGQEYRREEILYREVSVNGWGQPKMPDGKHYNALRLERIVIDTVKTYLKVGGAYELETTTPVDTYYVNEFWGKNYGLPMCTFISSDPDHKKPIRHEILDVNNTLLSTPDLPFDLKTVKVFPNPVQDLLHFSIGENTEVGEIEIHNLTGQRVLSAKTIDDQTQSINLSHLNPGVYLLSYMSDSNKSTVRIIKK